MPLPLIVKAALIGGAAYAASRWYASKRQSNGSNVTQRYEPPTASGEVLPSGAQESPWPSAEAISRSGL